MRQPRYSPPRRRRTPPLNCPLLRPPEANYRHQIPSRSNQGYLGIVGDDHRESGAGVRVLETESGGPADHGGLKADDLITGINGKPVHGQEQMRTILEVLPPGSKASFEVEREGKKQTIDVTLGTRPPQDKRRFAKFGEVSEPLPEPGQSGPGAPSGSSSPSPSPQPSGPPHAASAPPPTGIGGGPRPVEAPLPNLAEPPRIEPPRRAILGVRTQPVDEAARRRLGLPAATGALVVSRTPGSPAEKAGIPLAAAITALDGAAVNSPEDLARLVAQAGAGRDVEVSYIAEGGLHRVKVRISGVAIRPESGGVELPNPPHEPFPAALPDDHARIETLERRVQELENRVHELEQTEKKPR